MQRPSASFRSMSKCITTSAKQSSMSASSKIQSSVTRGTLAELHAPNNHMTRDERREIQLPRGGNAPGASADPPPRGGSTQGTSADPSSEESGPTVTTDTVFPEGGGSRALIPAALQTALDLAGPSRSWPTSSVLFAATMPTAASETFSWYHMM